MLGDEGFLCRRKVGVAILACIVYSVSATGAGRCGWHRREVNWHLSGGYRVKAISYPRQKAPKTLTRQHYGHTFMPHKKVLPIEAASRLAVQNETASGPIVATIIDSPPVDGFVPWVAVSITKDRSEIFDLYAVPTTSISNNYPDSVDPQSDYAVGIFDTGASAHVIGNAAAWQAGLFYGDPDLVTNHTVTIFGVSGSVEAWVSEPIGLFIDGLGAIEPNGLLIDRTSMVGETNVAITVGQGGVPDLPTAIGSPLSVYFSAVFSNDQQITLTQDGNELVSPDIRFYGHNDSNVPEYSNIIPLELRPLGGITVGYLTPLDIFDPELESPASPSIITGLLPTQSVFFVHSVDLYEGDHSAIDKDRFMFDTGAQITVIGSRVAARLGLNPAEPSFEVEIQGVTGDVNIVPGFYIDSLEIPALGEWLSFTNVPVVLLDVFSSEGGTVDGIIGMNLFVDLNFVFRGGGLFLQDDPAVKYDPIYRIAGDIAPIGGDGSVDFLDIGVFAEAWLAIPTSPNWYSRADMFGDAKVDFRDLAILAEHWLGSIAP